MACGAHATLVEAFWFGAKETYFPKVQRTHDEWLRGKTRIADDFWSLQTELRLQCNNRAAAVFDKGPPHGPHSEALVQEALAALQGEDGASQKKEEDKPAKAEPGHDDADYDDDEDDVDDNDDEAKAASASKTAASADPAGSEPAASAGAGSMNSAADAAVSAASSKPGQPKPKALVLTQTRTPEERPLDSDAAAAEVKKKPAESSSSDSYYDDESESASKGALKEPGRRARNDETDSSQDKPPKSKQRLELRPSPAQLDKEGGSGTLKSQEQKGTPVNLKGRVATQQDLHDAMASIRDTVREEMGRVAAGMAVPVQPVPYPVPVAGGRWFSAGVPRNMQSGWVNRKAARAFADRERRQAGLPKPEASFSVPMCKNCQRNQPGVRCSGQLCRHCCADPQCAQHHGR